MRACIFIEGGAHGPHSKDITIRCQKAFHKLLDDMGFAGRKPRLVACGGRQEVYKRFCSEHGAGKADYVAMWIDSEDPIKGDIEAAWKHLASTSSVPKWPKPALAIDEQVLFMSTCMETLIVADRSTLREHYGQCLHENSLPKLVDLESKLRQDVQSQLETATQSCQNAYAKGKRSYDVFEKLQAKNLRDYLPSVARTIRILEAHLK